MTDYKRIKKGKHFIEVNDPDVIGNVAQDKAYLNSKRCKAFNTMTIQELRKYATIAWTGVKIRSKMDKELGVLQIKLIEAKERRDEESMSGIMADIRLLNKIMEVE